jgi:hypothetical protein
VPHTQRRKDQYCHSKRKCHVFVAWLTEHCRGGKREVLYRFLKTRKLQVGVRQCSCGRHVVKVVKAAFARYKTPGIDVTSAQHLHWSRIGASVNCHEYIFEPGFALGFSAARISAALHAGTACASLKSGCCSASLAVIRLSGSYLIIFDTRSERKKGWQRHFGSSSSPFLSSLSCPALPSFFPREKLYW